MGGFFLLLIGFLAWASGPGARWGLRYVIDQQLEAQLLSGRYEVQGNLLTGISLHNISLTGESKVQEVKSDLVRLDWSVSSLMEKKIESITLNRLDLVIDPKAPAPPSTEAVATEKAKKSSNDPIELARELLGATEISLNDLNIEVVGITTLSLSSISHEAGTNDYLFRDLRTTDHRGRAVVNAESTLTWHQDLLSLDQLSVHPDLSVQNIEFIPEQKASGELLVAGSLISATSDLRTSHQIELKSPTLDIAKVAHIWDPELPVEGTITRLAADTGTGIEFAAKALRYEEQKIETISLTVGGQELTSPFGKPLAVKLAVDGKISTNGTVTLNEEDILKSTASLEFNLENIHDRLPPVTGTVDYEKQNVHLVAGAFDGVTVNASYAVESQTYTAKVVADVADASRLDPMLTGPLQLNLTGNGTHTEHQGSLDLGRLRLNKDGLPDATTSGQIDYDWPHSVTVKSLQMTAPEGQIETALEWKDETLTIDRLNLTEGQNKLLTVSGKLPAPLKIASLEEFLDLSEPVKLNIKSVPLTLQRLSKFAPIPKSLSGITEADLTLNGTLKNPQLNGFATLSKFRTADQPKVPPIDVSLKFRTTAQQLMLQASATEPDGPLINVAGDIPFLPRAWLDREKSPAAAPINLEAISPDFDLTRIKPFAPNIKVIEGNLKLNLLVDGTLANPDYRGSVKIQLGKLRLEDSPISDFRNSSVNLSFQGKKVTVNSADFSLSGGDAKIDGTIDLAGDEPVFDINASGRYFLLTRTPDFTFRGHPKLKLSGPLSKAAITGTLEIAESLIYKDFEILPFGVPRSTDVPRPSVPSFSSQARKGGGSSSSVPAPFGDWALRIKVVTGDPILIRGNLAQGEVRGDVMITGTIGDPKTSGTLNATDLVADLPFSELKVTTGKVILREDALTNPFIDVRGSSQVGQYLVQLYVTGPVQNPKLIFTSSPPLPENEIMLLLATGSASAQLEDRQVASQKALQYLLEGFRRRNRGRDKTLLQRFLKNSDQIDLSLGDTNQFTGRKFSSATLELSDQWDFTTQIDDQGQTRALVVFSLRFK